MGHVLFVMTSLHVSSFLITLIDENLSSPYICLHLTLSIVDVFLLKGEVSILFRFQGCTIASGDTCKKGPPLFGQWKHAPMPKSMNDFNF